MKNNKYIIPSLKDSIAILEIIANNPNGITLGEINKLIDTPKATIFRILATFEQENVVEKNDNSYHISFRIMKVGLMALSKLDLRNIATPYLYDLSIKLKETVHLAVLSDKKSLIIEVCDSPDPVKISSRAGTTVDLHCSATGKIFLAYAVGEGNIKEFFKDIKLPARTGNTITNVDELINEIKKIKINGFAFDNEEFHEGVRCLGVPIMDAYGNIIAAIGLTATSFRFQINMVETISNELILTAKKISQKFGG